MGFFSGLVAAWRSGGDDDDDAYGYGGRCKAARIAYDAASEILEDDSSGAGLREQALKTMTELADWDDGQGC